MALPKDEGDGSYSFEVPRAGAYKVKVVLLFSASLMRFSGDDRPIDEKPEETQTIFEHFGQGEEKTQIRFKALPMVPLQAVDVR